MVSDDEDLDCPLCMEEFDIADRNFRPCPCGYQICRFCWHHIKSNLNGRCPACRRTYTDQIVQFIPVSKDEIVRFQKEKKEKERQHKDMKDSSRKHLSNVRVVQKNLVYVLGLSSKHANAENELFKKYGKIAKLVVSKRTTTHQSSSSNGSQTSSVGIYITYQRKDDAAKAIAGINGSTFDGRSLRASYGTTKYCTYYLRHMACPNPNCMYLHEPGEDVDSYTKDSIGKPQPSGSSTTSTVPSKRPAPAQAKPATTTRAALGESSSSTSTSQMAVEPASPPKKSAWAPIPKVVPPPPPPPAPIVEEQQPSSSSTETPANKEEEPVSVQQQQQRPLESTPAPVVPSPKQRKQTHAPEPVKSASDKATKPIAIEKKPALPAAAAWGKGTTGTSTGTGSVASSLENSTITTPVNFGPSLSDALSAPQKPKHSPTIPRKKEKKLKSKMVRLEEFEEGLKNNTNGQKAPVAGGSNNIKGKAAVTGGGGTSALSTQLRRSGESAWQPVPKPTPVVIAPTKSAETPQQQPKDQQPQPQKEQQQKQKQKKQPAAAAPVKPKEEPVSENVVKPEQVDNVRPKEEDVVMAEPVQELRDDQQQPLVDQKDEALELKKEEDQKEDHRDEQQQPTVSLQKPEAKPEEDKVVVDQQVDHVEEEYVESTSAKVSSPSPEFSVQAQPSFTSYVLGDLMVDDVNQQDEHGSLDDEGGLSSLKADLASEDDEGRLYDHMSRSEKVQQDELGGTSPLGALDHGMIQPSPERPPLLDEQLDHVHFHTIHQQQHGPSPTLLDDLRMPMEQHGSGRAHGPPPGFSGPPEWQSHHFDPFNGQDPAAARRLQHSQQMLEASGLFPGFGRPPPPPPPSLFDFHGNTPPPPPGMFGLPQPMLRQPPPPHHHHQPPPPPHHPHRHPDFMNMPPGLGPMGGPQHHPPPQPPQQQQSPMENHHHDMMHLENNMQRLSMHQQQQQHPNGPMAEHREDPVRSMQDDLRALLPNVNISFSPMRDEDPSHKPHTPEIEDPFHRRPSDLSSNTPILQHESDQQQQQHDKILSTLTNNSSAVHKPDAYPEEEEEKEKENVGKDSDVKQEAQNFFGEFLRKAAASTPHLMNGQHYKEPGSMPFQDPAIMSVRMSNGSPGPAAAVMNERRDMTESQNAILQILGAQPQASAEHTRFPMERPGFDAPLSTPPAHQDMMNKPPFDMFLSPHQQQQQDHHHHHQSMRQPPPPPMSFHHQQHPQHQPPPQQQQQPPSFMSGNFGEMPMGMMPPPPHHLQQQHHHHPPPFGQQQQHEQPPPPPPPGMMHPGGNNNNGGPPHPPPPHPSMHHHHPHHPHGPPPPLAALMEMKFRQQQQQQHRNGNLPPGLFPSGGGEGL
ncbi:hypothetical protein O0I10_001646 [Lichtheimia ornata]|uniref:Uncharacterized protein n=1 Tax=Lichtheimia ornata TaxID=688661 RepID=A0AAD7VBK6_9FUNG|nr:uncharacterized protein O0I10_001646 [Lichtheimia ornata]KAJ8662682.1 hypothetical protein O0I10_001646 [Lichtheimia ornata]